MIKRLIATVICGISVIFSFAQETTSEIVGTILDGSTPVQGATVAALNVPTGVSYSTSSRKDGRYNLPNLRIGGPYVITVSSVGFKHATQDSIYLILGQEFKADFSLIRESKVAHRSDCEFSSKAGQGF